MADETKKDKTPAKVEITPTGKETDPAKMPPPASEAQVSHAHELADEETALKAQETAQEGERRKKGDPLGKQKAVEDELEAANQETASLKGKTGDDFIKVVMVQNCSAPHVGGFNVKKELGHTSLKERKAYSLPRNVAAVLVDAGKAVLIEDAS